MSIILKTGTLTTGNDTVQVPGKHTGRFGLQLNGNFDTGNVVLSFGITSNLQPPKIINPETALTGNQLFGSNGLYYVEVFCDSIDLRIQNALGAQSVAYVLFIGARP